MFLNTATENVQKINGQRFSCVIVFNFLNIYKITVYLYIRLYEKEKYYPIF